MEPDEARVETQYHELIQAGDIHAESACMIHTLPPPTQGDISDIDRGQDQIVEVRLTQYSTIDDARYWFENRDANTDVPVIGEAAKVRRGSGFGEVQILSILQGNLIIHVRIDRFGSAGSPVASDQDADLTLLQRISATVVEHL